jgi:hypothetical protein
MRLIFGTIVSATALVFALACGDDDGDTQTDDNGDDGGGRGGGSGNEDPKCKGVYAAWTASELEAAATAGACEDDAAVVCGRDLNFEAGLRGKACFEENPDDSAALAECTLEALKSTGASNPSDACLGCYIASLACVQERCLSDCLADPTAQVCIDCRAREGCTQEFFDCSGLPSPVPAPND